MSADVLRRAAALMRERAGAATPGPWEAMTYDSGLSYRALNAVVITEREGDRVAEVDYDGDAEGPHAEEGCDAAHIASWHPAVALAVADWLDEAARWHEHHETWGGIPFGTPDEALAVARAYLGETA